MTKLGMVEFLKLPEISLNLVEIIFACSGIALKAIKKISNKKTELYFSKGKTSIY